MVLFHMLVCVLFMLFPYFLNVRQVFLFLIDPSSIFTLITFQKLIRCDIVVVIVVVVVW